MKPETPYIDEASTLSPSDVAARLGISPRTVKDMARRREIAHVKIGRRIRFTEQGVQAFIQSHTIGVGMTRTQKSQAAHRR